jgi:hypothetical protein
VRRRGRQLLLLLGGPGAGADGELLHALLVERERALHVVHVGQLLLGGDHHRWRRERGGGGAVVVLVVVVLFDHHRRRLLPSPAHHLVMTFVVVVIGLLVVVGRFILHTTRTNEQYMRIIVSYVICAPRNMLRGQTC